jgi:hypothetical protein
VIEFYILLELQLHEVHVLSFTLHKPSSQNHPILHEYTNVTIVAWYYSTSLIFQKNYNVDELRGHAQPHPFRTEFRVKAKTLHVIYDLQLDVSEK